METIPERRKVDMGFNKDQLSAINAPITEDILVAAGAGSGKTKVLAEKVFKIIDNGEIKPSELLVLTFTDNAAHQMRDRIIKTFKDRGKDEIAEQVACAHIQTFDSFARYLVALYADRLGISSNIMLANSDVITAKKNVLLDEILHSYYIDENKRQRLIKTLCKFNMSGDENTKTVILDLYKQLDKLSLEKKEKIINHYDETYLSDDYFKKVIDELVAANKRTIIDTIKEAWFVEKNYDVLFGDNPALIAEVFNNPQAFEIDENLCNFLNQAYNQETYQRLKDILRSEGSDFLKKIKELASDETLLPSRMKNKDFEGDKDIEVNKVFRSLFKGEEKRLESILLLDSFDKEIDKLKYFQEDIALMLEIIKELDKGINDYKRVTNSFEFNDILLNAVSLLTNPKYQETAKIIRSQFKLIMVDEYQDTNDFQEDIINSLLEEKEDGTRAHLFCVGDAKQAIYGFRNSKVELFVKRQEDYQSGEGHGVITMHKNYRSGKALLHEINHVFNFYMTLAHGGIDYAFGNESLEYDDEVGLYSKYKYEDFGVSRITSVSGKDNDAYPEDDPAATWEAFAIAHDIKQKVENHFQVYKNTDEGLKPMDCDYDDFVIIMRTTKGFDLYQRVFKECNILLNNKLKADLREINAILLIQSLVELIANEMYDLHSQKDLLFASVARSYIYRYKDQIIYDILKDHDESKMEQDKIMQDVHAFVERNRDSSAYEFFTNMINDFGIVTNLCYVGDIETNVSKIESLAAILSAQEDMGDGLEEFVNLLKIIDKYRMGISTDTAVKTAKAVDMMTIHASKGLEQKIVYLPVSYNKMSTGNNAEKPDYIFDENYGIILPYYNYDENDVDEEGNVNSVVYETLPSLLIKKSDKDPERDEHVRLFYVALTRAQNIVYIVGDRPKDEEGDKKSENLYGMLSYLPHYLKLDEDYAERKIKEHKIDSAKYKNYLNTIEVIKGIHLMSKDQLGGNNYQTYSKLFNKYYSDNLTNLLNNQVHNMLYDLFKEYYLEFKTMTRDANNDANVYALYKYNDEFSSFEDLEAVANEDSDAPADLGQAINEFVTAVCDGDLAYFLGNTKAKDYKSLTVDGIPYGLFDTLMPVFVRFFDDQKRFLFESYENKDFKDNIIAYDYYDFERGYTDYDAEDVLAKFLDLPTDDSIITFPTITKERASKQRHYEEAVEDTVPDQVLNRGVYLHRLMELANFVTKDTSFIKNEKDRKLIDSVLSNPVFDDLSKARIYKEYGYYDELLQTTGFIDLLYFKDDECYIVDYKSRSIDDEAYERQLHVYQRNVQSLFNVKKERMHLYLLSLSENRIKEVQPE